MTLEEKLKALKEKGFTYNSSTGEIHTSNNVLVTATTGGYIVCGLYINRKKIIHIKGHQFAWYWMTGEVVKQPFVIDHINRNRTDNRFENLRVVTNQQNTFNANRKGYVFDKVTNKYRVRIMVDGKMKYQKSFHTEEEAKQAYLTCKEMYHQI